MKIKSLLISMVLIAGLVILPSLHDAQSAETYYARTNIDVITHYSTGTVRLNLSQVNGIFTGRTFEISGENTKSLLAVALTCKSLNKTLAIKFTQGTPDQIVSMSIMD